MDLYTDLFVTNNGYFFFNKNIYQTSIQHARNRSAFVVGYPDSSDILFSFGSEIESLSVVSKTVTSEICKCHDTFGKVIFQSGNIFKGVSTDKKRFLKIQQNHLPIMFKHLNIGMKKANKKLYIQLIDKLNIAPYFSTVDQLNMKQYNQTIRSSILIDVITTLQDAGDEGVQFVKDKLKFKDGQIKKETIEEAALGITFNIWDPQVQNWIDTNTAKLVQGVGEQTKAGIKDVITRKVEGGLRIRDAAREIRPLVGLNKAQANAVLNFEERLIAQKIPKARVAKRVNTYTNKLHRLRAQTIARTESRAAVAAGQLAGYKQSYVTQVRFSISAGACPICSGFEGRIYPINKARVGWESIPREPGIATGRYSGFTQDKDV